MEIRLKNIGLIEDSAIKLEGLTVIAGMNNSAKSTVGKVLYSVIESLFNIENKHAADNILSAAAKLNDATRMANYLNRRFLSHYLNGTKQAQLSDSLSKRLDIPNIDSDNEEFYQAKIQEQFNLLQEVLSYSIMFDIKEDLPDDPNHYRNQYLFKELEADLKSLETELQTHSNLHEYFDSYVNEMFSIEFNDEIRSKIIPTDASSLIFSVNEEVLLRLDIDDKRITHTEEFTFHLHPINRVLLIDDAYVLDKLQAQIKASIRNDTPPAQRKQTERLSHQDHLIGALRRILGEENKDLISDKIATDKALTPIKKQLNAILPGSFRVSTSGLQYKDNKIELNAGNLATGSKMFALLKMLLTAGVISESTLLILDEPEAHLHPAWQNSLAEIIVILVKEMGIKVLLTTHSANFMIAIDAFMRKYEINHCCNFYQTELSDQGTARYHCVNEDMGVFYEDFLAHFSDMQELRELYI